MTIELVVPGGWTPRQTLLMRNLLQEVLREGFPVVAAVRSDVTPDQLEDVYGRVASLLQETGLAA